MNQQQTNNPTMTDDGRVNDDADPLDRPDPQVPAKARRRVFSPGYKLRILAEYEAATAPGAKGALLRRERLYSAHIIEWRKLRDRDALAGLSTTKGRPPNDTRDKELADLRAKNDQLEKELAKAQFVIDVQGKLAALLEKLSESAPDNTPNPHGSNTSNTSPKQQ